MSNEKSSAFDPKMMTWLTAFVNEGGGVSGTIHSRVDGVLKLSAALNIPPPVIAVIGTIPKGKGMAGLAWERRKPVSTCNLQTDTTGDVRPGAKAVGAQAAVALPIGDAAEGPDFVVGIAFMGERTLGDEEHAALQKKAESLLG